MGGLQGPQVSGNPFATGQAAPGTWGSPNLSFNPYLSPYMGFFSGQGSQAQPLFSMPPLGPRQQQWMSRMGRAAAGSTNYGMIPLPVTSATRPAPPSAAAPSGPVGGPTMSPSDPYRSPGTDPSVGQSFP